MITWRHIRAGLFIAVALAVAAFGAGIYLAVVVPEVERQREADFLSGHPFERAGEDFTAGRVRFVRVWRLVVGQREQYGSWVLPGEEEISRAILERYPATLDLRTSVHPGSGFEQADRRHREMTFARLYNLEMARLIEEVLPHRAVAAPRD